MGKEIDLEDFDFGFTGVSSTDIVGIDQYNDTIDRVNKIKKMMMPLLNNLLKQDGDYIYWPNRKEKIEEFIKKMNEV